MQKCLAHFHDMARTARLENSVEFDEAMVQDLFRKIIDHLEGLVAQKRCDACVKRGVPDPRCQCGGKGYYTLWELGRELGISQAYLEGRSCLLPRELRASEATDTLQKTGT